jgi:hypothetical protein
MLNRIVHGRMHKRRLGDHTALVIDVLEACWTGHMLKRVIGKDTQRNAIDYLKARLGALKPAEVDRGDIDDYCKDRAAGRIRWIGDGGREHGGKVARE